MGGNVDVFYPDGNVYSKLVIMLCLALDHKDTELHCLNFGPQGRQRLSVM